MRRKSAIILFSLLIACNNAYGMPTQNTGKQEIVQNQESIENQKTIENQESPSNQAYQEHELALPTGVKTVIDMNTTQDGTLYLITEEQEQQEQTLWKHEKGDWKQLFKESDVLKKKGLSPNSAVVFP